MTSKQLWKLFLKPAGRNSTAWPSAGPAKRRQARERGGDHAPNHPGNRPAGDQL